MTLKSNSQFGHYRIVRLLGRGGMGEVFEVEHLVLKRRYALKLLPPDFASRPEAIQRFEQEARVMANLDHLHIIKVDDFGKTNDRYWLRMELAKGLESGAVTLEEFAATGGGRIRQIEYAGILYQLLEALAYAHERGVVHRDLKPGNVLLGTDAAGYLTVKISDFGLARLIGEDVIQSQAQQSVSLGEAPTLGRGEGVAAAQAGPEKSTSSRSLLGTWEYMSPEQRRGETADARSDVYSLGLMSFRLLTGKGLGMKLPSEALPELHREWDAFIAQACELDPGARHANGRAMFEASVGVMAVMIEAKEALKTAVARQAEEARQQEAAAKAEAVQAAAVKTGTWSWVPSQRWGWAAGVVALALLGVAGWQWWPHPEPSGTDVFSHHESSETLLAAPSQAAITAPPSARSAPMQTNALTASPSTYPSTSSSPVASQSADRPPATVNATGRKTTAEMISAAEAKRLAANVEHITEKEWEDLKGATVVIDASTSKRIATGLEIKRGERYLILPCAADRWNSSPKRWRDVDFRGHVDQATRTRGGMPYLQLCYSIDKGPLLSLVDHYIINGEGLLFLGSSDLTGGGTWHNNKGRIRVKIVRLSL